MYKVFLVIHIVAGFLSLATAVASILSKCVPIPHRWHLRFGKGFMVGMAGVFLTAIPMCVLRPNTFLFLTALFSFYFAVTGWRCARNRTGKPSWVDYAIAVGILVTSVAMLTQGVVMLRQGSSMGTVMCVFAVAGAVLGVADGRTMRRGELRGRDRIAKHVSRMFGGTIATVTAFVVVNFRFDPMFVLWLGPGVVMGPLLFWLVWRVENGKIKI